MKEEKKILIATYNQNRLERFGQLLHALDPNLKIIKLTDLKKIRKVDEDEKTELGNMILKLESYYKKSNIPTLAFDDGLILKNKKIGTSSKIHRNQGSIDLDLEKIYDYWSKLLVKYGSLPGTLIKTFGYKTSTEMFLVKKEIPVTLVSNKKESYEKGKNPLNYFIIPKGYKKTFSEMNEGEISKLEKTIYKDFFKLIINL